MAIMKHFQCPGCGHVVITNRNFVGHRCASNVDIWTEYEPIPLALPAKDLVLNMTGSTLGGEQ